MKRTPSEKRNKSVKIRVTEAELQALRNRCDAAELAPWMRATCLNQRQLKRAKVPKVDPALLRQIAGVGNNLNQIARVVNIQRYETVYVIRLLTQLAVIERQMENILIKYQHHNDC